MPSKRLPVIIVTSVLAVFLLAGVAYSGYRRNREFPPYKPRTDGIPILMYHKVDPSWRVGGLGLRVPPEKFDWQMHYLYEEGFHTVSLLDVIDHFKKGKRLPFRPIVITFDDGYKDNYTYAYPILKKYHFTATIFVVAGAIGKTNYFDVQKHLQPVNYMLTWPEIKALDAGGITIGAHTVNHHHLAKLPLAQAAWEIRESKKILEKGLGKPVLVFSYPYGSFNKGVEKEVKEAGFRAAVSTIQGKDFAGSDPYALKRIRVMGMYSRAKFVHELSKY